MNSIYVDVGLNSGGVCCDSERCIIVEERVCRVSAVTKRWYIIDCWILKMTHARLPPRIRGFGEIVLLSALYRHFDTQPTVLSVLGLTGKSYSKPNTIKVKNASR